jgi:hypothetical protein
LLKGAKSAAALAAHDRDGCATGWLRHAPICAYVVVDLIRSTMSATARSLLFALSPCFMTWRRAAISVLIAARRSRHNMPPWRTALAAKPRWRSLSRCNACAGFAIPGQSFAQGRQIAYAGE